MEWSLGVEPWSVVLGWNLEWSEVRYGVIVALLGQDLVLIDQFPCQCLLLRCTLHFLPLFLLTCAAHMLQSSVEYFFHISNPHPA